MSQQAGPWGVAVRGTRVPRGGGYGVVGEALTGLWRVAAADARLADLRQPLADRAECIAGLAIDVQVRDGLGRCEDGAWFIDDVTRMDDQQHAISALLRTTAIVDTTPSPGHPAPSAWLWALALLGHAEPAGHRHGRADRARPRAGDDRRARRGDRRRRSSCSPRSSASRCFDALGVSRPAGRLAVGIVAAVTAIVRLARRAPAPAGRPRPVGAPRSCR